MRIDHLIIMQFSELKMLKRSARQNPSQCGVVIMHSKNSNKLSKMEKNAEKSEKFSFLLITVRASELPYMVVTKTCQ